MKKTIFGCIAFTTVSFMACSGGDKKAGNDHPKPFPKPGALVASAEMPVTNDPLNKFTFSVKVIADSNITSGTYDVDVDYGPNFAEGQLTMPKGGEHLQPIIRKGDAPYTYIIGFRLAGDTTFYDYFQVTSSKQATKMQYIKAYTF